MDNYTSIWGMIRRKFRDLANINEYIDRESAAQRIKEGIWFKGPNIWILAFSIIIASVGLNVNSTAVIIGAMLISPLMGPIVGVGFAVGTQDSSLLEQALKNLIIMVTISLLVSCIYFIVTPLNLVDPTELQARTRPTIYDVLIALFGGLAGILETCRKDRGTVISGVAIATALMPPLCTAGYGLAHLSPRFFFGALFLFLINATFIILATYLVVRYLHFEPVGELNRLNSSRGKRITSYILALIPLFRPFPILVNSPVIVPINCFVRITIITIIVPYPKNQENFYHNINPCLNSIIKNIDFRSNS